MLIQNGNFFYHSLVKHFDVKAIYLSNSCWYYWQKMTKYVNGSQLQRSDSLKDDKKHCFLIIISSHCVSYGCCTIESFTNVLLFLILHYYLLMAIIAEFKSSSHFRCSFFFTKLKKFQKFQLFPLRIFHKIDRK